MARRPAGQARVPKPARLVLVSRGSGVWWRELVLLESTSIAVPSWIRRIVQTVSSIGLRGGWKSAFLWILHRRFRSKSIAIEMPPN
jgi:hypothetical protein